LRAFRYSGRRLQGLIGSGQTKKSRPATRLQKAKIERTGPRTRWPVFAFYRQARWHSILILAGDRQNREVGEQPGILRGGVFVAFSFGRIAAKSVLGNMIPRMRFGGSAAGPY